MSFFSKYFTPKRIFPVLLSFFLIISFAIFFLLPKPQISFQELTNHLFFEDITTDTLSLHYTLAYPSHYSIHSYPLTLPKYDKNTLHQTYSKIENSLAFLNNIDTSQLTAEELYCYQLLTDYFALQKKGFPFTYLEEYFSPASGIPANFPILMAEYTFRTKQDITDYLALLADIPNYFLTFFEFEKERASHGYTLSSTSLQDTIKQCDTIITQKSLDKNSHFLQSTFRERLSPLVAKKIISRKEALNYIAQNNTLLTKVVLPAFQTLKSSLMTLQTLEQPLQGLYQKEQGKEYYEWLVQKQTGCFLSIPEILTKLEEDYTYNLSLFRHLQQKLSAFGNYETYINQPFPLNEKNEILKTLRAFIQKDFPDLTSLSDRPVTTTIKSVSSCMEEYTSPAFYLIPPIDDIWQNTIYINNSSTPQGLDLFTTLAHEGFPGHLYQTVYYQLYSKQINSPLIRHLMNFGGYVEGWAIYSEFYAYDYAAKLYPKEVQPFYTLWHQLLLCDKKLQLAILSILDIKLHYYNNSLETAKELLHQYGITNEQTIADIYQYILEEPGNYLKYYMGYLCLTNLKEKAKSLMGSGFSDLKFHEFILTAGPSDFQNLERKLQETFSNTISYSSSSNIDSR